MEKFQVVAMVEGQFVVQAPKDIYAFAEVCGYEFQGVEERGYLRPELQGQPKFKELAGPMWGGEEDGAPVIRYESWEAYKVLSV